MKFEVVVERHFPQPVAAVWAGLTSRAAVSAWLMETDDFVAEIGHRFTMHCVDDHGHRDDYRCEVLALEEPNRMLWSWVLAGSESKGATQVEFRLIERDAGTTVTVAHRGDRDRDMLERFRSGWPAKLDQLAQVLDDANVVHRSTR